MVTLVQLVAALGPALVPLNEAARAAVQIDGIHISELRDPAPYLEGGELLLTTGMSLGGSPGEVREYVERLHVRGVSALGLGVGLSLDDAPEVLRDACTELGLPLLVVPADQRFVHITRVYWDLVAASGRATLVAQLGTQTALVREAGKPDGVAGVVSMVAQAVGGWAAYIPLHGADPVIWPESLAGVLPGLQAEVRRFAERGNVGAATFPLHGYDVVAHPVGSGAQIRGAFAVGMGRRPSTADKQVILTATAAIGLRERVQGDAVSLTRSVGEAVVNLLIAGEATAAQALIETTGGSALPATVRVLAFPIPDDRRSQQAGPARLDAMIADLVHRGLISPAAAERSRPARAATVSGVGVLLLSGPQASDGPADMQAGADATTLTGALSEVVRPAELAGAVTAAIRRVRDAAEGEVVTARHSSGPGEGEDAIERLASYTRAPLVETVRAYLRHRGGWEAAARELAIHRNTIRNRIRIVQEELGIDLDDPDLSARLWLALRAREGSS